jgi:hypothetical protein
MFMNTKHFQPPFGLTKFLIAFTHTHKNIEYGGGVSETYNVVKDCKEEIQGGTSEISKLLMLISLQITFQSTNEINNKNSKHRYHNRFVSVTTGIFSELQKRNNLLTDNLL